MGKDEFNPVKGTCSDWFNIGLTILDSLDTLILMDFRDEYEASRLWAANSLSFYNINDKVSSFELVIRATGGMNTAYQLTSDSLWLNKSVELADMLLESFNLTNSGCPPQDVYLGHDIKGRSKRNFISTVTSPAEAGTFQLEFRTLSQMTGDPKYAVAVDRCMSSLMNAVPTSHLVTPQFDMTDATFHGNRLCIGGSVDSYYEMLVKNWIVWGKSVADNGLRVAFEKSITAIFDTLARTVHDKLIIGEMYEGHPNSFLAQMDHLACFLPGTLAIGALHGLGGGLYGTGENDYMRRARRLTESCFSMTRGLEVGLAGEITSFLPLVPVPKEGQDINFLRPEIVEALYYMDKIDPWAGDKYKAMGRAMWKDIRRVAQIEGKEDGMLATTFNLRGGSKNVFHGGKLHSFVLAETLKYFFLLFDERPRSEGPFALDKWMYNTEAHAVRIAK